MTMVAVQSNAELEAADQAVAAAAQAATAPAKPDLNPLVGALLGRWQRAKTARMTQEATMMRSLRACNAEYEADMLAALRILYGSDYNPPYMDLTGTKARAIKAWIISIVFQGEREPWSLEPTPLPELPPEIQASIENQVKQAVLQEATMSMATMGTLFTVESLQAQFEAMMPQVEQAVRDATMAAAKKAAQKMRTLISDQFWEGGWYEELEDCIKDISRVGTGILEGPIVEQEARIVQKYNPMTGMFDATVEYKPTEKWRRVKPENAYPSPDATPRSLPWIFIKDSFTRKDLWNMIGVEGYNEEAIRAVLKEHAEGGLREWTSADLDKATLEKRDGSLHESELIDCLKFIGSLPGKHLATYNLVENVDLEQEYDIKCFFIGQHVIRCMLNPNPLGDKGVFVGRFVERTDSFWGTAPAELIEGPQNMVNACARSIMVNVGLMAGPVTEADDDRVGPEVNGIIPLLFIRTTSKGMQENPAIRFTNIPAQTRPLVEVFNFGLQLADDFTGVPRYVHTGQSQGGGAGETFGGLSMLMSHAAKGIQDVIRNIDRGIIEPSVEHAVQWNMQFGAGSDVIGDLKVIAGGSRSVVAQEQQIVRRGEFLQTTNNPVDVPLLGPKVRLEALLKQAKDLDIDVDVDQILAEQEKLQAMGVGMGQNGMMPPGSGMMPDGGMGQNGQMGVGPAGGPPNPKARALDAGGQPPAGRDMQINESRPGVRP